MVIYLAVIRILEGYSMIHQQYELETIKIEFNSVQ